MIWIPACAGMTREKGFGKWNLDRGRHVPVLYVDTVDLSIKLHFWKEDIDLSAGEKSKVPFLFPAPGP